MVSYKIEKQIVLIMYLSCLWWSTTTTTRIHVVKAQYDSLKPRDESQVIYSKQGKFHITFGDFVGYNKKKYLIIATRKAQHGVAWMYDRTHPINIDSPFLSLDNFGVLKIVSEIGKPIIIYSPPQPVNNTVATMLDTGNFVLQQIYPNGTKSLLWQSFDYPTDTLIPTMKLGVNRKTGHNWSLVSPLTTEITTLGEFSLEWEGSEGQLNIKKRGKVYWKSGKLGSNGLFKNIPVNVQHMYQYVIVSNKDEDSFALKLKDHQNYTKYIGWVLLSTGRLTSDEGDIANADLCYGYNSDEGCQKWEDIPTCRDEGEVFQKKNGTPNLESNATSRIQDNALYDYSDCKEICWRNCKCTGFKEFYDNGTGCILYSWSSTKDVKFYDDGDFYLLVKPIKVAPNPKLVAPKVALAHHGKEVVSLI